MKKTKRLLALLLALLMTLSLAACGGQANTPAEDDNAADTPAETRVFTDSTGRKVTVPAQIDKVAVSGPLAQIVLFALCPDKLVGVANEWDESAQQYLDEKYYNLPLLGQLYGGKGELNLETLLSSGAQVVIDVGEAKSTIVEDMNDLQEQTSIPFLHIDAKLVSMDETYTMLGDLLGMTDEAKTLSDYCRATYDRRLLVGETKESVLAPIQALLDDLMAKDPAIKAKVSFAVGEEKCYTGNTIQGERFFPGWLFDENDAFVQDILTELHAIGQTPEVTQYSFCTNGSHYAGEAGIKTVGMGPSRENLAHTDNEYIEIEQLTKVCRSYYAIMKALLK